MNRYKSLAAVALAALLLGACGTAGDILGGGNSRTAELRGTVEAVDTTSRSIFLTNVSGYNSSMLSNSGGSTRVYYDSDTEVVFNGQTYRPEDLERGDEVAVRVEESGNRLTADTVTVTRDVTTGTSSGGSYPSYGSLIRGTVVSIDNSRRTIEVDQFSGPNVVLDWDANAPVYYNNQTYRVGDLERGDEIEIRTRDLGSGRMGVQDITVTRNVSSGTSFPGSSTNMSTLRGTVRYVDTARRTIEVESASWISNFNSSTGSGTRYTIQYDTNARVDVNGSLQPVTGLEPGDVIEVQVSNSSGSTLFANRIFLVRDVRR